MKKFFSLLLVLSMVLGLAACAKTKNKVPEINGAKDQKIEVNGTFDPKAGVTVKDEDANIQEKLQVFGWEDSYAEQAGIYEVVYYVSDSKGLETIKSIELTVGTVSNAPVIEGVKAKAIHYQGQDYDPFSGVTAKDGSDDISEELKLKDVTSFDDQVEGVYGVTLFVLANELIRTKTTILVVRGNLPDELDTSREITLRLNHAMGEANQNLMKKYAASFMELYPNVTIEIPESAGNYDTLKDNTINQLTAGNYPNLVQSYPDHVAEYLNSKAVLNLNPYIYNKNYGLVGEDSIDDIIQSYLNENSQYDEAGTFYSLPFNKSTEVLVYNKTVFDLLEIDLEKLETWQGIMEIAPLLKAHGEKGLSEEEKKQIIPVAYDSSGNGFISIARQWGGAYTGINFETGRGQYLWQNAQTEAGLQYFKDQAKAGLFTLPDHWDQQYASTPFIAQQTFITIGSSAGVRHNMPQDKSFQVDTAPVPYNADMPEHRQVIQQGTNIAILSHGDEQVDLAAWLFLKHMINTENTLDWAMNTGYVPVRESAFESDTYQTFLNKPLKDQDGSALGAKATFPQRDFMFYDPAFPGSSKARALVGGALERIITGDGNITAALQDAYNSAMIGQ